MYPIPKTSYLVGTFFRFLQQTGSIKIVEEYFFLFKSICLFVFKFLNDIINSGSLYCGLIATVGLSLLHCLRWQEQPLFIKEH
jgi:hypothetical protein